MLLRFARAVTFTGWEWRRFEETAGAAAAGTPRKICGGAAPGPCTAGAGCGCALPKFFGETTGWPIALRTAGIVVAPRVARLTGLAGVLPLGLMVRICCCVTPCGGSTSGATIASASSGTLALLGAGCAPLAPFPLAPLLAEPARAPCCAWPSLAKHGFAASVASTMLERTSRKRISLSTLTYVPGCGGISTGATGPAPSLRSRNNVISAGTATSRTIGPINIPPTTTVASGRCT
jgi:hypothetical protein